MKKTRSKTAEPPGRRGGGRESRQSTDCRTVCWSERPSGGLVGIIFPVQPGLLLFEELADFSWPGPPGISLPRAGSNENRLEPVLPGVK